MSKINLVLISLVFAGGVGTGLYLGKRKYEGLADLEVEQLKRYYEDRYVKSEKDDDVKSEPLEKTVTIKKDKKKYEDYSKPYQSEESKTRIPANPLPNTSISVEKELTEEERRNSDEPYLITPGEFGDSTYEAQTLFFYADRVLADDDYNIVDDVPGTIGEEALSTFGMYEEDCVYVRNDKLGIDYEILIDERYFANVSPRPVPGLKKTE